MSKNKLLLLLVLLTMLSTRAVAQNDPSTMRAQMKERLDELKDLAPDNVKGLNETLKNDVKVYIAQYTEWYNASKSYEEYDEAYGHLGFIIDRVNKYLAAYGEFTVNLAKLKDLTDNFNAGTEENKQGYKTFALNVYNAYKALSDYDMIALDDDDLEKQKNYDDDNYWVEPYDVTSENIESVADAAKNHEYISTYGQFNAFFSQNNKELGSIYLEVAGTGTAESPEDLTAQLRNPNLENAGEQWWGTDWTAFGNSAAEQSGKPFITYQQVHLPKGYYTLVGYGIDRRGSWADVLANDEDWNEDHRTSLFSHLGDDGDSIMVDAFKAKNMALTADITNGAGNISTCKVDGVTYYTPNSMAQYRAWEDAKIAMTGNGHGAVLQFWVWQDEGDFGTLGFAHPWHVDNTWFVADGIQLYYAKEGFPDINIDTPITPAATGYSVTMAEGTEEADKWTVKVGEGEAKAFPVEGLKGGETVTATYSGDRKVKSVKAVKKGGAVDPAKAYMAWDADQKKLVATAMPTTATKVEDASTDVEWQAGTYVVEGNVTINGRITLNGDVNLIIKDGAKLTAQRISGNSKNLSIYGQANQTGELVVNNSGNDAINGITTFEVHSAKVTSTSSGNNRGGFYYIGTFNVYGGLVDAKNTAEDGGYGIGMNGGFMNIYGGEVKAEGKGDNAKSNGIHGGDPVNKTTVTVYGGKLWAGNADDKALRYVTLTIDKSLGFNGEIEESSDNSTWHETVGTPDGKYVRVGY